ncbi:MAG: hypothetical protein Q8P67_11455 [archaeon]|nr:hypothetical protein [archaeon]
MSDGEDEVPFFNGLGLKEIQRRARVLKDRTEDPLTWRYRSSSGFLGEEELLEDVISKDEQLVRELGSSHLELADMLASVVSSARALDEAEQRMPERVLSFRGQQLHVTCQPYMSPQFSLFWNEAAAGSVHNTSWSAEYHISHPGLPGYSLLVGGDDRRGSIDFIRHLGFYQGGAPLNDYRLDPSLLLAILTGSPSPSALACLTLHQQARLHRQSSLISELEPVAPADDPFLLFQRSKLEDMRQQFANDLSIWTRRSLLNSQHCAD